MSMSESITYGYKTHIAEWRWPSESGEFLLRMPLRPDSADADDFIELLQLIQKQIQRRKAEKQETTPAAESGHLTNCSENPASGL